MVRDILKAVRRDSRKGQQVLRKRGGFHSKRGYKRPTNKNWEET